MLLPYFESVEGGRTLKKLRCNLWVSHIHFLFNVKFEVYVIDPDFYWVALGTSSSVFFRVRLFIMAWLFRLVAKRCRDVMVIWL